jgi:amidase
MGSAPADAGDPYLPASELVALLRSGATTSVELVDSLLDRIGEVNPALNAVVTLDADGARRAAAEADQVRASGRQVGPLHGLPITLKDSFATAGLPTTAGKPDLADHVPDADAVVVERLRSAGAIVLGKTNLPTGVSGQETANQVHGRTCNPWDRDRTPGGSSGGAASALAAGLTPLDVGSDSGGSIRQPAHCCGVYGHLASHGLVPQRGHLPSVPLEDRGAILDMFSVGPMARHPADLALVLPLLIGDDPLFASAAEFRLPPPNLPASGLQGVRVAVVADDPACPSSAEVRAHLDDAAALLRDAGAELVECWPPFDVSAAMDVAFRLWVAANATDDDGNGGTGDALSVARQEALHLSHAGWLELDTERRRLTRCWTDLFRRVDVALLPISPVPAVLHDPDSEHLHEVGHRLERSIDVDGTSRPYLDQVLWNVLVGMAGLPATAVPLGRTGAGLPVGGQVVAAQNMDLTTIAFATRLAEVGEGFTPPPGCP